MYYQGGNHRLIPFPFYVSPYHPHPMYPNVPMDQQHHWMPPPYPNAQIANGRPSENEEGDGSNHTEEERQHSNYPPPPPGLPVPMSGMQQQSMYQMMVPPLNVPGYPMPYPPMYGNPPEQLPPVDGRNMQQQNGVGNRRTKSNKASGEKSNNDVQYSPEHDPTNGDVSNMSPINTMPYPSQHPNFVNMPYSAIPYTPYSYYSQTAAHISAQHATGSPLYMPIYQPMFPGPIYPSENAIPVTMPTSLPTEECKLTNQREEFSSLKITDYVEGDQKCEEVGTESQNENQNHKFDQQSYDENYSNSNSNNNPPLIMTTTTSSNNPPMQVFENGPLVAENCTVKPTRILGHNENAVKYFPKEIKENACLMDPAIIMSSVPINPPPELVNDISAPPTTTPNVVMISQNINNLDINADDAKNVAEGNFAPVNGDISTVLVNGTENASSIEEEENSGGENVGITAVADAEDNNHQNEECTTNLAENIRTPNNEGGQISHNTSSTGVSEQEEREVAKDEQTDTKSDLESESEPEEVPTVKTWAGLFKTKTKTTKKSSSAATTSNTSVQPAKSPSNSAAKPFARVEPFQNPSLPPAPNENCFGVTPSINLPPFNAPSRQSVANKVTKSPPSPVNNNNHQPSVVSTDELMLRKVGEFLRTYKLDHRAVNFETHGLLNRGNSCYINAILQALIACPPFYNLMKALSHNVQRKGRNVPSMRFMPILDSTVQMISEFSVTHAKQRKENLKKYEGVYELTNITALEPSFISKMLAAINNSDTFVMGQQEDAQEFLTCLLNGLNDEMLELIQLSEGVPMDKLPNRNLLSKKSFNKTSGGGSKISNGDISIEIEDNDSEWKEVHAKNKSAITYRQNIRPTPISAIFRGQMRSRLQKAGDSSTNNIEPFFTLHLNIEKVNSVKDALELLVGRDVLEGVTSSKTNQEVDAWQQQTLEELPYVLLLHLKCFDYKNHSCSKIIKTIDFPIDLRLDSKVMTHGRNKPQSAYRHRQYKLFAVVYHDGKEATKGHYLTDVFHVGYSGWIRYDDSKVYVVEERDVLKPKLPRMPYLLYYRRCDTIAALMQPPFNNK